MKTVHGTLKSRNYRAPWASLLPNLAIRAVLEHHFHPLPFECHGVSRFSFPRKAAPSASSLALSDGALNLILVRTCLCPDVPRLPSVAVISFAFSLSVLKNRRVIFHVTSLPPPVCFCFAKISSNVVFQLLMILCFPDNV